MWYNITLLFNVMQILLKLFYEQGFVGYLYYWFANKMQEQLKLAPAWLLAASLFTE